MSSKINDGGPAFPIDPDKHISFRGEMNDDFTGMSLRDYFAAQAMPGVISACKQDTLHGIGASREQHFAIKAYAIADAMLEARK